MDNNQLNQLRWIAIFFLVVGIFVFIGSFFTVICFLLVGCLLIPPIQSRVIKVIPELKPMQVQVIVGVLLFLLGGVTANMVLGTANTSQTIVEKSTEVKIFKSNNNENQTSQSLEVYTPVIKVVEEVGLEEPESNTAVVIDERVENLNVAEQGKVKKSKSNICHDELSPYYLSVENYTPYFTVDDCLKSGGRLPDTPDALKVPDPVEHALMVKKSRSSICHAPGTTYYARTKNYTPYSTLEACLSSGGRLPKR